MGMCVSKRQRSDDEYVRSTVVRPKDTQLPPQPNGFPLPNEVVEHVTLFLRGYYNSFADRVRVAAVCRQLRTAVLSNMRQMESRYLMLDINNDRVLLNDIQVKNDRNIRWRKVRSPIDQMECILALIAFAQPTQLDLWNIDCKLKGRRLIDVHRILSCVSPLSITRLRLQLHIGQFSDKTPFTDVMEVVGAMTNLEILNLFLCCKKTAASLAHWDSLTSVPANSPFSHLLKLERLRGFTLFAPELVSANQLADLINRSPAAINHLCCLFYMLDDLETMLESMNAAGRANITSVCVRGPVPPFLLVNLPNCRSICHFHDEDDRLPAVQKVDKMADDLLTKCHDCADSRGKTLRLQIGLRQNELHKYLKNGGLEKFSRNRSGTVVNVNVADYRIWN